MDLPWTETSRLDRVDHHRKSPGWVAGCWTSDDAKLLKFTDAGEITTNEAGTSLRMSKPFVAYDPERHYLLGLIDGAPVFAVQAVVDGTTRTLRECGSALDETQRDIAATAVALCQWHALDPHCPTCGAETVVGDGGMSRSCRACGRVTLPRTDPAVIVAIRDPDDRLLLASQARWPEDRRSVLAGFVEVGESLEQAVHREMAEEADLTLVDLRYEGSQPWPFPRSLMVAFSARTLSADFSIDGDELVAADWYSRAELRSAIAADDLTLPPTVSIARRLIDSWLADTL